MVRLAQNEMKAKGATPLRVRLTDGLGGTVKVSALAALAAMNERIDFMWWARRLTNCAYLARLYSRPTPWRTCVQLPSRNQWCQKLLEAGA